MTSCDFTSEAVTVLCSALSSPTCATREPANKVPTISVSIWQDLLRNEFSTSKNVSRCIRMYQPDIRLAKKANKRHSSSHNSARGTPNPTRTMMSRSWTARQRCCLAMSQKSSVPSAHLVESATVASSPVKSDLDLLCQPRDMEKTIVIIDRNIHRNQEMCTCPLLYCSFNLAWQRKNFPGCASTVCSSSFVSCLKLSCLKPSPVAHPASSAWGCRG